jgi:hypothetical protein
MPRYNLEIYVPFLQCPCGPSSPEKDRQAEDFQQTLIRLKNKYKNEISYMVYALNLHLQQFKARPELAGILQSQGKKGLPAIFVNDRLVFQGAYPTLKDMEMSLSSEKSTHEQI